MAIVDLTVVKFGSSPVYTVLNQTDTFLMANDGLTKLYVENNTNQALTATVIEQRSCNYGHATTHFTFYCPASVITYLGTFRKDRYNRVDGKLAATFTIPGTGTARAAGVYDVPEDGRI